MDRAPAQFSPDGQWLWTGDAWISTVSEDRQWRWTYLGWVRNRQPRRALRPVIWRGAIWLVLVSLWCPVLAATALHNTESSHEATWLAALLVLGTVVTVWFGRYLGREKWWLGYPLAVVVGTAATIAWYTEAFLAATAPDEPGADASAAVASMPFVLPVAAAVALLLVAGLFLAVVADLVAKSSSARRSGSRLGRRVR